MEKRNNIQGRFVEARENKHQRPYYTSESRQAKRLSKHIVRSTLDGKTKLKNAQHKKKFAQQGLLRQHNFNGRKNTQIQNEKCLQYGKMYNS